MDQIFSNYERQADVKKEMIIILNRDDMDLEVWRERAKSYENVSVYKVSETYRLGKCLNYGIKKAKYDIIAKFDDDDYYAADYLKEALDGMKKSEADIIGKNTAFIYFEENKALMIFRDGNEMKYTDKLKGGTLVFKRSVWDQVKFSEDVISRSDEIFLKESIKKGFKLYAVSKYNYVCIRRKDTSSHTQKLSAKRYMEKCRLKRYTDRYMSHIIKKM